MIRVLGEVNGTQQQPTDATRAVLWSLVFTNWDPVTRFWKPQPLGDPRKEDVAVLVGRLKADCPGESQRKRQRDGTYVVPDHRRGGAKIWLKPAINWNGKEIYFKCIDKMSREVDIDFVAFDDHLDPISAKVLAIQHYDEQENGRVGEWNIKLVVYWARASLVLYQRDRKQNGGVATADIRVLCAQVMPNNAAMPNFPELQTVRLCKDVVKQWVSTAEKIQQSINERSCGGAFLQ